MNKKLYTNGKIFNGETILEGYDVLTEAEKIVQVARGIEPMKDAAIVDLQGKLLAPAFLDLQIYGGNGLLFGEFPSVEALQKTYEYCVSGGATHFLPTVATNSEAVMNAAIEAVRAYWQQGGEGVLGLHLEGPYISIEKRGAHLQSFIQTPTIEKLYSLFTKGADVIKMMTVAPEVCSGEVLNFLLQQKEVIISSGHTNATYEQAMNSFNKGIKTATHLFNAMSPLQHRAPGMVGAILDRDDVNVSLVADGHHVDFAAIRIAKKILQERLFLITDAVTENRQGQYSHRLQGDKYVIADGTLSGSALTMLQAVQNCVNKAGISLQEALRMASLYPARAMSLERQFGRIEEGFRENFVILNTDLALISVITT